MDAPPTRASLAADLAGLGVAPGDVLLVHCSLRAVGWICGGPVALTEALLDAIGPAGTLVAFSQTMDNRDPSRWSHAPVPPEWWPTIREHLPAFAADRTPCREMGLLAETIRTWPGATRSGHPQTSFVAVGARAGEVTAVHDLDSELGERSPLAALERAGARALLIGVDYDRCTSLHLAEYRQPHPRPRPNSCVMMTSEGRRWVDYVGHDLDSGDFVDLGRDFELTSGTLRRGTIGRAEGRLLSIPEAVAFATGWLRVHRLEPGGPVRRS